MFVFLFVIFSASVSSMPPKDALNKHKSLSLWANCNKDLGEGGFGWVKSCDVISPKFKLAPYLDSEYIGSKDAFDMQAEQQILAEYNTRFIDDVKEGKIQKFAVKVMDNPLANQNSDELFNRYENMFTDELKSIIKIMQNPHDNILKFHAVTADEAYIYMFMPAYENMEDMHQWYINRKEAELVEKANILIPQILKAVLHLNQHGIMHRDIKPDNFLVSKDSFEVVLIDFGLATPDKLATACAGTIEYMAPDVIAPIDYRPYDAKVDAWSVGVVIYQIISGTTPFNPTNKARQQFIIQQIADRRNLVIFDPQDGWFRGIGLKWRSIAYNLLNKDADHRWDVAEAFDMHKFCSIDAIVLQKKDVESPGRIEQAQMWDALKNHGFLGRWKNRAQPEAMQDTFARHGIDVSHAPSRKITEIKEKVTKSVKSKISILSLQKTYCK